MGTFPLERLLLKIDRPGNSLSLASARSKPAALFTPISAENNVTEHSPAKMRGEARLVIESTLVLAKSDEWVVLAAKERITVK